MQLSVVIPSSGESHSHSTEGAFGLREEWEPRWGGRREGSTLVIERDVIQRRVDFTVEGVAFSVDVRERIVTGTISRISAGSNSEESSYKDDKHSNGTNAGTLTRQLPLVDGRTENERSG